MPESRHSIVDIDQMDKSMTSNDRQAMLEVMETLKVEHENSKSKINHEVKDPKDETWKLANSKLFARRSPRQRQNQAKERAKQPFVSVKGNEAGSITAPPIGEADHKFES